MNLADELRRRRAREGETWLRVRLTSGKSICGLYMGYGDADDNAEGVASLHMTVQQEGADYGLLENEIASLEVIRR